MLSPQSTMARTLARAAGGAAVPLLALALASCGGSAPASGTGGTSTTAAQHAYLTQISASVSKPQPAGASLGSKPDLGAFDAHTYISDSGLIAASEPDGQNSDIFVRTRPSAAWHRVGSVPGLVSQIDFSSSEQGFALARKSRNSALGSSRLYSTSDGGKTWQSVFTGAFAKIYFFDSRNGVALFGSVSATSNTAVMLTSDGGHTWHQSRSNPFSHIPTFAAAFSFISPKMGWLAIANQPSAGSALKYLFRTTDGGQTWAEVASPSTSGNNSSSKPGGLPVGGYLNDIAFVSPSIGYMILGPIRTGTELETTDGGAEWHSVNLNPNGSNGTPAFVNFVPSSPYGALASTEAGSIWIRPSKGANWSRVYPPYIAQSISFDSGQLIVGTEAGRIVQVKPSSPAKVSVQSGFGQGLKTVDIVPGGEVAMASSVLEIYKSGKGWTRVQYPQGWKVGGGRFISTTTGLVVTDPREDNLELTRNGGKSWTEISLPFMPHSLDPTSPTNWWMVGIQQAPLTPNPYHKNVTVSNDSLFHTTNGGKSWTRISAPWGPGGLFGVTFASSTLGYAWNNGEVFVTTDAGRQFKSYVLPQTIQISGSNSLTPGPGGEVWIATYGYPLFASSDYGADWSALD